MSLDVWSIGILIIICQGVFLLSVLLLSPHKRNKRGSLYLFSIILVLTWFLIEFLAVRNTFKVNLAIFYGTRYGSWFLLGPLTFFYFKSITDQEWKLTRKAIVHFLPFVIFVIVIPAFGNDIINTRQVDYGMLSVFDHRKKIISPIQYAYSFVFIIQFIHLGCYLLINLRVIKKYADRIKLEYAAIDSTVKWSIVFNIVLLLILLFSVVFLYILLMSDIYRRHLDYIYLLPTGVLFYLISYYLMNAQWKSTDKKNGKYSKSSLKTENIAAHVEKLNELMHSKKVYLDNEIRLRDVAKMMEVSSHHLSQIINESLGYSFFDFINEYRVEEAKKLIIKNPKYTLLRIAFDAGFNNKTSFVNAFKKFENKTPSAFRKEQKTI